jgi:hypothetical protein
VTPPKYLDGNLAGDFGAMAQQSVWLSAKAILSQQG